MRYLKQALRRFSKGQTISSPHQKYDGIMIGIAENIEHCEGDSSFVAVRINRLNADSEFKSATGVGSNYKERVKKRIERAKSVFSND